MSATPNCERIEKIAAAKTAHQIFGILDGTTGLEIALDAIEFILSGDWKDNLEKACILDFCIRHARASDGGLNMKNVARFSPIFTQRTNKCSSCHLQGHDCDHCSSKMKSLSKRWGHM